MGVRKMSKELEALEVLMYKIKNLMKLPYGCHYNIYAYAILKQALEELEAIKSADGGEALEAIDNLISITLSGNRLISNVRNYILKAQAIERELAELKKTVMAFIDNHVAYPYDEDGVAYDDEYTKDYERLLELCKGSEE